MTRLALPLLAVAGVASGKPNVLFAFTDDQRFDTVAALGNKEIQTPTLDALVARGFTFSNAYCQGGNSPAVCVPSRTQMLTGKSAFRSRVRHITYRRLAADAALHSAQVPFTTRSYPVTRKCRAAATACTAATISGLVNSIIVPHPWHTKCSCHG